MYKVTRWLFLVLNITLSADQFSFSFYNDVFAKTDRHFTSGFGLSWIDDRLGKRDEDQSNEYSTVILDSVDRLPLKVIDTAKKHNAGIALSQIMITPSDKTKKTPQYDDMPYVGYLSLDFYLFEWNYKSFREFRIGFGVVGEESGAKLLQNSFHTIINNNISQGWDTQLGTQYTVNSLFRYGEKSWEKYSKNDFGMDWFNHFGIQAGNYMTDVFGGTTFRVGENYIRNFNVHYPYLKEEASLLRLNEPHNSFGWSISTGINVELLGYSYIFYEAKKSGYVIESNTVNISVYAGADLYYDAHRFTFFYQLKSPDFKQDNIVDLCGGFVYSFQF